MAVDADYLRAVIDRPDDDAPRLAYADYLDECGQAERAEFIRLQCRLATLKCTRAMNPCTAATKATLVCPNCREYQTLVRREWELLAAHFGAWTDGLPESLTTKQCPSCVDQAPDWETNAVECRRCESTGVVSDDDRVGFVRGFVEAIDISAADWFAHADAITAATPVRAVTLTTWPGRAYTMFEHSQYNAPEPGWLLAGTETSDGNADVTVLVDRERMVRRHLGERWPRVTFTLPPPVVRYGNVVGHVENVRRTALGIVADMILNDEIDWPDQPPPDVVRLDRPHDG